MFATSGTCHVGRPPMTNCGRPGKLKEKPENDHPRKGPRGKDPDVLSSRPTTQRAPFLDARPGQAQPALGLRARTVLHPVQPVHEPRICIFRGFDSSTSLPDRSAASSSCKRPSVGCQGGGHRWGVYQDADVTSKT